MKLVTNQKTQRTKWAHRSNKRGLMNKREQVCTEKGQEKDEDRKWKNATRHKRKNLQNKTGKCLRQTLSSSYMAAAKQQQRWRTTCLCFLFLTHFVVESVSQQQFDLIIAPHKRFWCPCTSHFHLLLVVFSFSVYCLFVYSPQYAGCEEGIPSLSLFSLSQSPFRVDNASSYQ